MKKFIWALVAALPLAFVACGDDEGDDPNVLTINESEVSIDYGKDMTLTASEKGCDWSSDNEYVATVDKKGKVTAHHVGNAKITASKDGQRATCNIYVVETNNNFRLPYTVWNSTMTDVQTIMTSKNWKDMNLEEVESDDDQMIIYQTVVDVLPAYLYTFENNKLCVSTLTVDLDASDDLMEYLAQYYDELEGDEAETETNMVFADGSSRSEANNLVIVEPSFANNTISALIRPIDHSRSVSSMFKTPAIERTLKAINKIKK